jgi:excisionase family DNA binding protein
MLAEVSARLSRVPGSDEEMTLPQVATLLGLNPSTIRLWVREKRIPARREGRKWLVRRGEVERLLDEQPRIGHPKRRGMRRPKPGTVPTDWSEIPEQASLNLASSIELIRGIR